MGRKAGEHVSSETKACPKKVGVILSPKAAVIRTEGCPQGPPSGCH